MIPRTVAIVSPHFPPSNLAGVHRARLLAQHLPEFGWRPVIVTTHWRHYEEELDWGLAGLVDPAVEVIHTQAASTRPVRVVGDIGVRALPWHLATLRRLRSERRIDFVLVTVPSFYSAMLGELLYRRAPLPFGIDYQDPWVHHWPAAEIKYSKAWASLQLAQRLEPWATRNAALITGVAEGYFEGVLDRNPALRGTCVTAAMPIGFSGLDFAAPAVTSRGPTEFDTGGRLPASGLRGRPATQGARRDGTAPAGRRSAQERAAARRGSACGCTSSAPARRRRTPAATTSCRSRSASASQAP